MSRARVTCKVELYFSVCGMSWPRRTHKTKSGTTRYVRTWKYSRLLRTSTRTLTWISFPTCGRLDVCKSGVCGAGLNRNME